MISITCSLHPPCNLKIGEIDGDGKKRLYRILFILQISQIKTKTQIKIIQLFFLLILLICVYVQTDISDKSYILLYKRNDLKFDNIDENFCESIPLSLREGIANKITAVSNMIRTYYLH